MMGIPKSLLFSFAVSKVRLSVVSAMSESGITL